MGQVPSNCTRQMPHTSSSGMSQRQVATAFHSLMMTFILPAEGLRGGLWSSQGNEATVIGFQIQSFREQ